MRRHGKWKDDYAAQRLWIEQLSALNHKGAAVFCDFAGEGCQQTAAHHEHRSLHGSAQ